MSVDPMCDVKIGSHDKPYWVDKNSGLIVCNRHKIQYDNKAEKLGPFDWEAASIANVFNSGAKETNFDVER